MLIKENGNCKHILSGIFKNICILHNKENDKSISTMLVPMEKYYRPKPDMWKLNIYLFTVKGYCAYKSHDI